MLTNVFSCVVKAMKTLLVLLPVTLFLFPGDAAAAMKIQKGDTFTGYGFNVTTQSYAEWRSDLMLTNSAMFLNTPAAPGGIQITNYMQRGMYSPADVVQTSHAVNGQRTQSLSAANRFNYSHSVDPGWGFLISRGLAKINVNGWQPINTGEAIVSGTRSLSSELWSSIQYSDDGEYMKAAGINGISGYVKTADVNKLLNFEDPSEMLAYAKEHEGTEYIDVYDESKINVVDKHPVTIEIK